jgi:hypothetical protein
MSPHTKKQDILFCYRCTAFEIPSSIHWFSVLLIKLFKHLYLLTFLYRDYLFIFLRGVSTVPRQATFHTVKSICLTIIAIHHFHLTLNSSLMLLLEDINSSLYLHLKHLKIMNKADCSPLHYSLFTYLS